jgi:hypothetical protein
VSHFVSLLGTALLLRRDAISEQMSSFMMTVFDWVASASLMTALLALPVLVVNWLSYVVKKARARRSASVSYKFPIKSVLLFSVPVLTGLCVGDLSIFTGRVEVMRAIDSLTNNAGVSINGKFIENPKAILSVIKTVHWVFPHHSHPTKRIDVEIFDQSRHLLLSLARDSDNPREYWVFYPKYYITRSNEIGRVVTPAFDAY